MRYKLAIYYYRNDKSHLLANCLLPLLEDVKEKFGFAVCYLQKHWKFGPHIRLIFEEDESQIDTVRSYMIGEMNRYLASHPSQEKLDEVMYVKQSERLGTLELESGPYSPLYPDHELHVEPFYSDVNILGGMKQVELKDKLLTHAMPMIMALLLETQNHKERRLYYVLQMMVMLADQYPKGGLARGQLSYRSHLEDFLFEHDKKDKLRGIFQYKYEGIKQDVIHLVDTTLQQLNCGQYIGDDPLLQRWSGVLQYFWSESYDYAARKDIIEEASHLQEVAAQINEEAHEKWSWDDRQYSEFHQALRGMNEKPERIGTVNFSAYRWNVNMFYLLLPLLDVSPQERYYLCFVLLEAVEDVLGVTWKDMMGIAKSFVEGEKGYEAKV